LAIQKRGPRLPPQPEKENDVDGSYSVLNEENISIGPSGVAVLARIGKNFAESLSVPGALNHSPGVLTCERQLASKSYDCVVIGAGVRLPPRRLALFEAVINAVHKGAPGAAIAFNTRPDDSADAAARWLTA
jgi:hypothetical protein